jgi:hypothetical protein
MELRVKSSLSGPFLEMYGSRVSQVKKRSTRCDVLSGLSIGEYIFTAVAQMTNVIKHIVNTI